MSFIDLIEGALVRALVAQPWFWAITRRRVQLAWLIDQGRQYQAIEDLLLAPIEEYYEEPPAPAFGSVERAPPVTWRRLRQRDLLRKPETRRSYACTNEFKLVVSQEWDVVGQRPPQKPRSRVRRGGVREMVAAW